MPSGILGFLAVLLSLSSSSILPRSVLMLNAPLGVLLLEMYFCPRYLALYSMLSSTSALFSVPCPLVLAKNKK
ncbi:hypothetical protein BDQ17DRAFT_1379345 [Cyathus striatus]|nr:hypothetical protein BDQ17DRAFT_1379345 [Cyathus striatus]